MKVKIKQSFESKMNKHESMLIKKKFKSAHTGGGGGEGGYNHAAGFRGPRHPHKDGGNRFKRYPKGCWCCVRQPKQKYVKRVYDKREEEKNFSFLIS